MTIKPIIMITVFIGMLIHVIYFQKNEDVIIEGANYPKKEFWQIITLFGFSLANLLSGAFLVEVIMSWPGLGRLTLDALFTRDLYLVMGSLLMASVMLILGNLAADIMLALSDPRISYE